MVGLNARYRAYLSLLTPGVMHRREIQILQNQLPHSFLFRRVAIVHHSISVGDQPGTQYTINTYLDTLPAYQSLTEQGE